MGAVRRPRVLLLYYTYTQQTLHALEAAAEVFRDRGCDVEQAAIEFTDKRWAERFTSFPLRRGNMDVFGMLPAQLRRATGEIRIPDAARRNDYDLILIGSPTWWLTTNMPIRSFLKSDSARELLSGKPFATIVVCRRYWRNNFKTVNKLAGKQGGRYIDGVHFGYEGGQVRSLLSLLSYLGSGEYKERYWGVRIPRTNLEPAQLDEMRAFATRVADLVFGPAGTPEEHEKEEVQAR